MGLGVSFSVLSLALGGILVSGCVDTPPPLSFEEKAKQSIAARAKEWATLKTDVMQKAEAALSGGRFDEARGYVSKYSQSAGAELSDFRQRLELAQDEHKKKVERENTLRALTRDSIDIYTRKSLLQRMVELEPSNPRWNSDLRTAERKIESELVAHRQREVARKRKAGVTIGMSQEDVLASNWGRPQSRNISHYSFGTHEQWVYGGGQYLYFENGILKSMQQSR